MVTYKIKVLKMGCVTVDKGGMTRATDCGTKMVIPQLALAIEGNGRKIIADTGIHSVTWVNENVSTVENCSMEEDESMENALAKIGWKPEEVHIVVNTHLHYDHCGSNYLFKNASFYIQQMEWEFANHPTPNQIQYYNHSLFDINAVNTNQIIFVEGEYEISEGLVLIATPGHTKGHQSLLINTEDGVVCYAGDAANLLENLELDIIGNILYDTEQAFISLANIRHKAEFVIPGHEPRIKKYQTGGFLPIHTCH